MSGNLVRWQAITAITEQDSGMWSTDEGSPATHELFNASVFGLVEMQKRLPKTVFKSLGDSHAILLVVDALPSGII